MTTIALSLLALTSPAQAESPLEPAYLEVLVIDHAEVRESRGEVSIAGELIDASCGDGRSLAVCGTGQAFVVFLDAYGSPSAGYFGEVLDWTQDGPDLEIDLGGLGAARLDAMGEPFKSTTYEVHDEDERGIAGAVAHLDEKGGSVWAVEGTTLTPGELVSNIGEDCWLTAEDAGVRAIANVDGSEVNGIWGTGGVAVWGTDGAAIWGTGGVASDTKTIWGTGGVSLGGKDGAAIWGTGGVAIWGTGGTAAVVPYPGSASVFDELRHLDAPELAAEGLAVEKDWAAATHMSVSPL